MASNSDANWRSLIEQLDRVIDLPESEQAAYLTELQESAPETAAQIAAMLQARGQDAFADFLAGSPLPEAERPEASLAGRSVGVYIIDAQIGRGGMGSVWRAHRGDGRFDVTVAIKFVQALWQGGIGEQRFRMEGRLLGQLKHPNIAHLLDAGVLDGAQPYLVIEYVEGEQIDRYCARRELDLNGRVELFMSVLAAVAHAHSHLIVHRDLKPANVFVTGEGTVKLLDFGIAKLLGGAPDDPALTKSSMLPLTPQYATPEQVLGQPVTTGTDVYALGLVLYVLLTGKHPVAANSTCSVEFIQSIVKQEAPPASAMASIPGIPPRLLKGDLDNILAKALKKSPAERYESAAAFAQDLRRYLNYEPVQARPDSLAYRAGRFLRRHRTGVAVSAAIGSILIAAVVGIYMQKVEADRERAAAQIQADRVQESYRFLSSMVEEIGAEGGTLTPAQILDRGMYLLDHQTALDPRSRVDELRQMGTFYTSLFEPKKERDVLARAEQLARQISYTEGLIGVLCDEVDTELDDDHRDKAQLLLAEARGLLEGLRRPPAMLRANIEEEAGNIAAADDHNEEAVAHAQRALEIMRAGGAANTPTYAAVLSRLSVYHDALGHAEEAHRYTELAGAAWETVVGSGSIESLTNLNNESVDLLNFGEVKAALAVSAEVLRRLQARGAGTAVQVPFRTNYGSRLASMGRYQEAIPFLDQAIAAGGLSHNQFWQQRAQYFRACALVHAGRHSEAKAALDEIESAYRTDAVKNAASLDSLAVCRSEWLLGGGDAAGARAAIEGLLKSVGYPAHKSLPVLRSALPAAALIGLAAHDLAAAQAYASAATEYATRQARDPNRSADVGRALLLLARSQHAAANDAAAVQSLQRALPALSGGLGQEHSEVADARTLLDQYAKDTVSKPVRPAPGTT